MNRRLYRRCERNIQRNRRDIKIDRVKEKKDIQTVNERKKHRKTHRKKECLFVYV